LYDELNSPFGQLISEILVCTDASEEDEARDLAVNEVQGLKQEEAEREVRKDEEKKLDIPADSIVGAHQFGLSYAPPPPPPQPSSSAAKPISEADIAESKEELNIAPIQSMQDIELPHRSALASVPEIAALQVRISLRLVRPNH